MWQVVNLHGDVAGTTDAADAFTAHPQADEFGVGPVLADRLGWLGDKDHFYVGGRLRLMRMGVRLYDTTTGRFTSVDPVEGGTPNDYVYPTDPVNEFDLTGERCWTGKNKNGSCRSLSRGAGRATRTAWRHRGVILAVGVTAGCAYASAGTAAAVCGKAAFGLFAASSVDSLVTNRMTSSSRNTKAFVTDMAWNAATLGYWGAGTHVARRAGRWAGHDAGRYVGRLWDSASLIAEGGYGGYVQTRR